MSEYEKHDNEISRLLEIKKEREWTVEEGVAFHTHSYHAMRIKQQMESKDQ